MSLIELLGTRFEEDEMLVPPNHDLTPFSIEQIRSCRFVAGHVDASFIDRLSPRPVVLTMLRDPIARAISHYYYFRTYPLDELPPDRRLQFSQVCESHSLLDYMERFPQEAAMYLSNVQTRFLGQIDSLDIQTHGREFLEHAQRNLERFEFLGLLERFQDSVRLLSYALEWPRLKEPPHINKTPNRIKQSEIDQETRDRLQKLNELDLELYQTACTIFASRYSEMVDNLLDVNARFHGRRPLPTVAEPLPPSACRIRISGSVPSKLKTDTWLQIPVTIRNLGKREFVSEPPNPTNISYHWVPSVGPEIEGTRTPLRRPIPPGSVTNRSMNLKTPAQPGRYDLRVTLVQEDVRWFDRVGLKNSWTSTLSIENRTPEPSLEAQSSSKANVREEKAIPAS